jgi:hypothetical protein
MKDLIIDTGRPGGGHSTPGRERSTRERGIRRSPPEDWLGPRRMRMRPPEDWECRYLGDRLAPLHRWLAKQVGRPWDDVYSEICQVADARSLRGYHLRQHVRDYVDATGGDAWSWARFVVRDGVLCQRERPAWWERPRVQPPGDVVRLNEREELRKIEGIWYRIELAPLATLDPVDDATRRDLVNRRPLYARGVLQDDRALYPRRRLYARAKVQLGKKELARRGLK